MYKEDKNTYDYMPPTSELARREEKIIAFQRQEEDRLQKEEDAKKVSVRTTRKLVESDNIAELLTKEELYDLAIECIHGLDKDRESMDARLAKTKKYYDLMDSDKKPKNRPYEKAANIQLPMMPTAVIQFQSRSLSEMIKNGNVANYKIYGNDNGIYNLEGQMIYPPGYKERRGRREAKYMNYQIMQKMKRWMQVREALHGQLPIVGWSFTKTYFDPIDKVNKTELCSWDRVIINNSSPSLEKAPRISEYIDLTVNDVKSRIRAGYFIEADSYKFELDREDPDAIYLEFVEQHCWLDLDNDGILEPYTVWFHKHGTQVYGIKARYTEADIDYNKKGQIQSIRPSINTYILYTFIPSMDNTLLGIGYGDLLGDMNETINTAVSQLMNSANLSCAQGGWAAKGLRMPKGENLIKLNEWISVSSVDGTTLKDNLVPFNFKEPSQVLFQLIQYLVEASKDLTSTTDVITGTQDATNVSPNVVLELQKQSLMVYTAAQRRIFRSFGEELQILRKLIAEHLNIEEYFEIVDPTPEELGEMIQNGELQDFNMRYVDIVPVVDVNESSAQQDLIKAQVLAQLGLQFASSAPGSVNPSAIFENLATKLEVEEPSAFVPPPPSPDKPDPAAIKIQLDQANFDTQMKIKAEDLRIKDEANKAKIALQEAQRIKTLKDADVNVDKAQLDVFKAAIDNKQKDKDRMLELHKINLDSQLRTDSNVSQHVLHEKDIETKREIAELQAEMKRAVEAEARRRGFKGRDDK